MKTIYTTIIIFFTALTLWGQAPQKMSYQAVVRDASDVLITETAVGMQISILEGSATGTPVYEEVHTPTTNTNGLATVEVGAGTVLSGDFSTIDWGAGEYYLKSQIDPTGGTSYSIEGTSQLLSVPYALYAGNVSSGSGNTLDEAYNEQVASGPRIITADDGEIAIVASGNPALDLTNDGVNEALFVSTTGAEGILVSNIGANEGIHVIDLGPGDGILVENDLGGDAVIVENDGGGDAISIDNAGLGDALFIDNTDSAGSFAVSVNNDGGSAAVDILNDGGGSAVLITNDGGGDGMLITQDGAGDAIEIDNDGGGTAILINNEENTAGEDAVDIINDGGGDALTIDNAGAGDAVFVDNTDSSGSIAVSINNDGGGAAVDILNTGGGHAISLENTGTGNAIDITSGGTAIGVNILHGNPAATGEALKVTHANDATAVFVDNSGEGKGVSVFNGNPMGIGEALEVIQGGLGTGLLVDNGGLGKAAHLFNGSAANDETVILATTAGTGSVARMTIEDNNANMDPVLFANTMGAGSAAEFITMDNVPGRVNDKPTVNVSSNGMGVGVNIAITNDVIGTGANSEPALVVKHMGVGQVANFETTSTVTDSHSVEIINKGQGNGLHIDCFDGIAGLANDALYVEQSTTSVVSTSGHVAVFDLHATGSSTDSAVLIRSGATGLGHSALRVIPADPGKLAGVFEGAVEIASDLVVGGSFSAMAKAFKIDHPLDPDNKYLVHNSIESNERVNIYSGNITTNPQG
ncbi:MAG: hypothetical protein AAFP76_12105, partial [Bacteroidota bacterium]